MITFDADRVKDRMNLLERVKPLAWKTYMITLAAQSPEVMIDFTKPVSEESLHKLNSLFDIDASVYFTVDDEEIKANPEVFLRPEE